VEDSITSIQNSIQEKIVESEHSGLGFLNLLLFLRRVFLQDAAAFYMDSHYSKYSVFRLPLLKSEEFINYQEKIRHSMADPSNKMLLKAGTETKLNQILEMQALLESRDLKHFRKLYEKLDEMCDSLGRYAIPTKIRIKSEKI
jgi:hypothetical protein